MKGLREKVDVKMTLKELDRFRAYVDDVERLLSDIEEIKRHLCKMDLKEIKKNAALYEIYELLERRHPEDMLQYRRDKIFEVKYQ